MLAEGIRDGFADLFAINTRAQELGADEVKNKFRTMYAGGKTNLVIGNIAKTFRALCDYADFSKPLTVKEPDSDSADEPVVSAKPEERPIPSAAAKPDGSHGTVTVSALQYHINIVLPDTRDQAVYDAIFKSLREHLG